jgi:hypothetical protein
MIKLQPLDLLLYVNESNNWLLGTFSRWAIGRYEHVSTYVGIGFENVPFIYQSEGRGVVLDSLYEHTGRLVMVMRPKPSITDAQKDVVLKEAIGIVSNPDSYYDYVSIVRFCVPYVLKRKFPWLPFNPPDYKRDKFMICSEAAAEPWWRASLVILPLTRIPLPTDFLSSPILTPVGEGRVMQDVIP